MLVRGLDLGGYMKIYIRVYSSVSYRVKSEKKLVFLMGDGYIERSLFLCWVIV